MYILLSKMLYTYYTPDGAQVRRHDLHILKVKPAQHHLDARLHRVGDGPKVNEVLWGESEKVLLYGITVPTCG